MGYEAATIEASLGAAPARALPTFWDGFSSKEFSDLLNTSATAVRMRLYVARKALSRLLHTETQPREHKDEEN